MMIKKRILSFFICFALVLGLACLNTAAQSEAYVMVQDFEDESFNEMTVKSGKGGAEIVAESNGNSVFDLSLGAGDGSVVGIADKSITPAVRSSKYTVQFDVKAIDVTGVLNVVVKNTDVTAKWMGVNIFPSNFGAFTKEDADGLVNGRLGEWFTIRMDVDETKYIAGDNVTKVFEVKIRKLGETEWKILKNPGGTYVEQEGFRPIVAGNSHVKFEPSSGNLGIGIANSTLNSFATKTPHYQIDNVTVFSGASTVVSGVWFENASGERIDEVQDGKVTVNFDVNNGNGTDSATAVFVVYDEKGGFVEIETQQVSFLSGNSVVSAAMDVENIDGGRIEAYLSVDEHGTIPFEGLKGVLGAIALVEESETNVNLGIDGEDGTYSFDFFDRSTKVNCVLVEGQHSKGERASVVVEAVGKTSGNILYFRQFHTKNDGTFKVNFAIAPESCLDDDTAVIRVKSADTTEKTFEIPVFSNWDAMVADFAGVEDAEDMEIYIDSYLDNLTVYESGKTDATEADVESIDYREMAFIRSMNEYAEDMTYAEMVETVLGLIADTRAAEVFAKTFASAQELETEAEQIEAIKTLITECEIIEFSTVGASNVDAICKALIASEATTLEGIYADFYAAYTNQKTAEEATVPGFTSITSGTEMKQFFADNEAVLGVDPEKYSDDDYAVMYGVYEEKEYSTLATYEAVNEAIVFLDNYINEYNQFMTLITNAATVDKNWETIKGLLNNNYTYVEIDLADESSVVNKEYLYKRLIDMDCTSLDSIEAAFSDAVAKQSAYETAAKDAFITIMDEASVKAYFGEYGDMLGTSDAKNYTDADLKVFVEVYNKFRPTAINYSEAKAQTENLIQKHKTAMKFVADINAKAQTKNWSGLKALYEGGVCAEFIGMDTATTEINDIRSMYMRIANNAPYGTLEEIESAWKSAYSDQNSYEDIAGGYETFEDEMFYFDDSAWNLTVQGNVVTVSGKADALGERYITMYARCDESFIYVKQIKTNGTGEFSLRFILNPEMYGDAQETILSVTGDTLNTYTFSPISLYSETELQKMVDDFLSIDSKADMKNYINGYGEELGLQFDIDEDRAVEAMYFLYDRDKNAGKYDSISDVDRVLDGFEDNGILSIMTRMEEMIDCLDQLTEAANKKVGSTLGQWKGIKVQVQKAIEKQWISPNVSGKISDESSMYLRMAGKTYDYMSDAEDAYEDAYSTQYKKEKAEADKKPSGGGGGGTGSGSKLPIQSVSGSVGGKTENLVIGEEYMSDESNIKTNQPSHPDAPFSDVTADYNWAKDGIDKLRRYGILNGDGNGKFRPADSISREEFVTLLLRVFSVEITSQNAIFSDVASDAWYRDAVATASGMGIVKGYPDGSFGVGNSVSRADMAVMVCRAMEVVGTDLDATQKAVIFNDRKQIPEYAQHSVSKLQQAGILNGDDMGNFNPQNSLSRAEAAVVFGAIFEDMNGFVLYAGQKIY